MFKRVYWQSYGYIYEGAITNPDIDLSKASNLKETIHVVDTNGKIIKSVKATPTNWYDGKTYNGFQFILDNNLLGGLEEGKYTFQIALTANGKDYGTTPLALGSALRSGAYHDSYSDLESTVVNSKQIIPTTDNKQPGLSIKTTSDTQGGITLEFLAKNGFTK